MNETVVLFSMLYLATLPACFHWPMYWTTIVRILVLLAVLTMNEMAVVPFTLLFLATLETFFHWPLVRRLVYRILSSVALRQALPAVNALADYCVGRPEPPWTSGLGVLSLDNY